MHSIVKNLGRWLTKSQSLYVIVGCAVWLAACQPPPAEVPTPPPIQKESPATAEPVATAEVDSDAAPKSNLAGSLILIDESAYPNHKIVRYDLEAQVEETVFFAPENSWIYQMDVTRDGTQVALSYASPPVEDEVELADREPYDRNGIYLAEISPDGLMGKPELLFGNTAANEFVFNPAWTADGKSIFYVSYKRIFPEDVLETWEPTLDVALMRYDLETAEHHLISQDGIWPRVSPDGTQLVYIQVDPISSLRAVNVSDLDGGNVIELIPLNRFFDIDSPHFSADGQHIYFGAVPHSTKVERNLWEVIFGIQVASAHVDHNLPSDWWRIPLSGGEAEKVTDVKRIISYGSFDSAGEHLFYATKNGIFSMDPNGEFDQRIPLQNASRYFIWTP